MNFKIIQILTLNILLGFAMTGRVPVIKGVNKSMVTVTYDRDAFPGIKEFFEVKLWQNFPGIESKVYGRANEGAQEIRRQDICKIFHQ